MCRFARHFDIICRAPLSHFGHHVVCRYSLVVQVRAVAMPVTRDLLAATTEVPFKHVQSESSAGDFINLLLERLSSGVHNTFDIQLIKEGTAFVGIEISRELHF